MSKDDPVIGRVVFNPAPHAAAQPSPGETFIATTGIVGQIQSAQQTLDDQQNAKRYREALQRIRAHLELCTPTGYKLSTAWHIANDALS